MTKKDFEAISEIIKSRLDSLQDWKDIPGYYSNGAAVDELENVANDLANYFIGENPRFDERRFLAACGF